MRANPDAALILAVNWSRITTMCFQDPIQLRRSTFEDAGSGPSYRECMTQPSMHRCRVETRVLIAVLLTAILSGIAVSSSTASINARSKAPQVIQGDSWIGPFRVTMRLADARRIFGQPTSLLVVRGLVKPCQVTWARLGLVMTFAGGCSPRSRFIAGLASGKGWKTKRGLEIGDTLRMLRNLYPDTTVVSRRRNETRWVVFRRGSSNGLVAVVRGSRVVSLEIKVLTISAP